MMEVLLEPGCAALPEQGVVRVRGADAIEFLHGQLTNAVRGLEPGLARPAAWCTPQGRVLANGVLWRTGADSIAWMVSRDLIPDLVRRLRLFVLRARVSVDADDSLRVMGVIGPRDLPAELHQAAAWTHHHEGSTDWVVTPMTHSAQPAAWRIGPEAAAPATASSTAWATLRLAAGWPWIRAATRDSFLPAALDLDLNGTIDFRKGCYPGQEVVARSHYRGTVKRRLAYGTAPWSGAAALADGVTDLYPAGTAGGRPIGRLVEAVVHDGVLHANAEITVSDWPHQRYAVGAPEGPVLDLRPVHRAEDPAPASPQMS
jgi:folate-binding protein YgfZ